MRTTLVCLLGFALVFTLTFPPPVLAEDKDRADGEEKKEGEEGRHESKWAKKLEADPEVAPAEKEEAKKLLDALDKAQKAKDDNQIVAAIEPMIGKSNEKFFKDLAKLAKHKSTPVRVAALKALGSQVEPAKKIRSTLFAILRAKPFKNSSPTLAMAIDSLRRQKCDDRQIADEIESLFKEAKYPDVMRSCVRYFGDMLMKDKVKLLIQWVEAPQPANVNSGTNPPASYWKRMWEIWNEIKETVWYSLETITGKDFRTKRDWEKWSQSPEAKRMGID